MKAAWFHPKARDVISEFPIEIKRELGKAIFDLQNGSKLGMPLSKSIASVGKGVEELRVKDSAGIYRVFYYTKLGTVILIFHAFQKKTQKTPQQEIDLGQKRLKEMLNEKN
jgi:phage-related protein